MKDQIDAATDIMLAYYGDAASRQFYELLKAGKYQSTRCKECGDATFPPRTFCPICFSSKVEWKDLPSEGTLYAFTQQDRSLRFPKPDVIGLVELEGVGLILSHIRAPLESLAIGQRVRVEFLKISDTLTLHAFAPV